MTSTSEPSSKPGTAALGLFSGRPQVQNFGRMDEFFDIAWIEPSSAPRPLPVGEPWELPEAYEVGGRVRSTSAFLESIQTVALLVLKDGELRTEWYRHPGGPEVRWMSWSIAKSFLSALVGLAIEDGAIGSVEEAVTDHVPSLAGTGYEATTLRNVLQMSSGARWNEDFSDPDADIHRMAAALAYRGTQSAVMHSVGPEVPPGSRWYYNTCDTQAAATVLTNAVGRSITDYMAERLCEPLGLEDRCGWILDAAGMEMAGGGIVMTARDYAKFGELYRNEGLVGGRAVLPASWVEESTHAQDPQVQPGRLEVDGLVLPYGYGYQWWLPSGDRDELQARGIYNQTIWVDRAHDVVIVQLAANPAFGTSPDEEAHRSAENTSLLRTIAASVPAAV